MVRCEDTAKLVTDSLEQKLSFMQKIKLWLHLMVCSECRECRSKILMMRQVIGKYVNADGTDYRNNRVTKKKRNQIKEVQKADAKKHGKGQYQP
jgi:hypothetical protein